MPRQTTCRLYLWAGFITSLGQFPASLGLSSLGRSRQPLQYELHNFNIFKTSLIFSEKKFFFSYLISLKQGGVVFGHSRPKITSLDVYQSICNKVVFHTIEFYYVFHDFVFWLWHFVLCRHLVTIFYFFIILLRGCICGRTILTYKTYSIR